MFLPLVTVTLTLFFLAQLFYFLTLNMHRKGIIGRNTVEYIVHIFDSTRKGLSKICKGFLVPFLYLLGAEPIATCICIILALIWAYYHITTTDPFVLEPAVNDLGLTNSLKVLYNSLRFILLEFFISFIVAVIALIVIPFKQNRLIRHENRREYFCLMISFLPTLHIFLPAFVIKVLVSYLLLCLFIWGFYDETPSFSIADGFDELALFFTLFIMSFIWILYPTDEYHIYLVGALKASMSEFAIENWHVFLIVDCAYIAFRYFFCRLKRDQIKRIDINTRIYNK